MPAPVVPSLRDAQRPDRVRHAALRPDLEPGRAFVDAGSRCYWRTTGAATCALAAP